MTSWTTLLEKCWRPALRFNLGKVGQATVWSQASIARVAISRSCEWRITYGEMASTTCFSETIIRMFRRCGHSCCRAESAVHIAASVHGNLLKVRLHWQTSPRACGGSPLEFDVDNLSAVLALADRAMPKLVLALQCIFERKCGYVASIFC